MSDFITVLEGFILFPGLGIHYWAIDKVENYHVKGIFIAKL
jgi:hypothetical protein